MTARQRSRRQSRRRNHSEKSPARRLIVAGGLTAGATLAMAGAAHAATQYTVGTLADDGSAATDCTNAANVDCTLRRAVVVANLDTAADKVVFRSGLSGSINLNPGGAIEIKEPLNVQGPGASRVTLDGEDTVGLFYVNPNTYGDPVTISGLTLTNAYMPVGGGRDRQRPRRSDHCERGDQRQRSRRGTERRGDLLVLRIADDQVVHRDG